MTLTIDRGAVGVQQPRRDGRWRRPALLVATLIASVGLGAGAWFWTAAPTPPSVAPISVSQIISDLDLQESVRISSVNGVPHLRGVVADDRFAALQSALLPLGRDIVNHTQSVDTLLEQVRAVFRTHGYRATMRYVGEARIEITNLDGDNPIIRDLAQRAIDDVPLLAAIDFDDVQTNDSNLHEYVLNTLDSESRLTTVIDGDNAYVASSDGGRYFVGSILPSGLVLRDIRADGIQVDDRGRIFWLSL